MLRRSSMASLFQQVLRLCTASLALGVLILLVRGLPHPAQASGATDMCSAPLDAPATAWIEQADARALFGDPGALFVDCRPSEEFQSGHISAALSMPSENDPSPAALAALRGAHTIVAYCDASGGCESSQRLAARLSELGMGDVKILKDGLPGWLSRGYPAESGPCRLCTESRP
jgi:rhodanese-related sulfurtransferase